MNDPRYRREVWFVQLAGELDALMTRAEALGPHLESLGDKVSDGVEFYDKRIAELTAEAQTNAMTYIVRRTKETAEASVRDQIVSIEAAVGAMFDEKLAPRLARLTQSIDAAADRASRARARAWLMHGAVASVAAVLASVTAALTFFVVMPLPGK